MYNLIQVYNWAPECYDRMSVSEDMPLSLKNKLQEYDFNESEVCFQILLIYIYTPFIQ
jgi:hypothetical protein